jgi:hypothetical protein
MDVIDIHTVDAHHRRASNPLARQAARRRMILPSRSTVRFTAAYACGPRPSANTEPDGSKATVTAHATLSHLPLCCSRRSTTRAPRTRSVWRTSAENTLYSAYVRACGLLDSSSATTSIRIGSIPWEEQTPRQPRKRRNRLEWRQKEAWSRSKAFRTEMTSFRMKCLKPPAVAVLVTR